MPLNLYREHTGTCSQKRRVRLHTRKAEESPRFGWRKCDCPIYASGTLGDGFKRRKTGSTTWPEAEAVVKEWEQAGAWAASLFGSVLKAELEPLNAPSAKKIEDALNAFIARCEGRKIQDSTLRKYKTFAKQFSQHVRRLFAAAPGAIPAALWMTTSMPFRRAAAVALFPACPRSREMTTTRVPPTTRVTLPSREKGWRRPGMPAAFPRHPSQAQYPVQTQPGESNPLVGRGRSPLIQHTDGTIP